METNFKELLDNTNLSMINILLSYQEEIASELKIYEPLFEICANSQDEYETYINITKLKEEQTRLVNLVKEFTKLINYIIYKFYRGHYLPLEIYERRNKLEKKIKYKSHNIIWLKSYLIEDVNFIIQGLWDNIFQLYSDKSQQNIKILIQERKDIEEFYISELNRLLDEKEAKIYELEAARFQDAKDINDLISENNDLRRVLTLNAEGEDYDGNN